MALAEEPSHDEPSDRLVHFSLCIEQASTMLGHDFLSSARHAALPYNS